MQQMWVRLRGLNQWLCHTNAKVSMKQGLLCFNIPTYCYQQIIIAFNTIKEQSVLTTNFSSCMNLKWKIPPSESNFLYTCSGMFSESNRNIEATYPCPPELSVLCDALEITGCYKSSRTGKCNTFYFTMTGTSMRQLKMIEYKIMNSKNLRNQWTQSIWIVSWNQEVSNL